MFFKNWFFKKKSILNKEDIEELKKIERENYLEEARKIVAENGKLKALKELTIKNKEEQ